MDAQSANGMRRLIYFVHATLDGLISTQDGQLWEPFTWGPEEMTFTNRIFGTADTWVFGRNMFEAIVPWWTALAEGRPPEDATDITPSDDQFAKHLQSMTKIVVSSTFETADRQMLVIRGKPGEELVRLKQRAGNNIMLSCRPDLLATLAQQPGLIDEYLVVIHPIVLATGKRLFGQLIRELPLELLEVKAFAAGSVALRYQVR